MTDIPLLGAPVDVAPTGPDNTYRWATVTQKSPLRVRLDGDTLELPLTPDVVGDFALVVGDRVWVQMFGRRVIVIGRTRRELPAPRRFWGGGHGTVTYTSWTALSGASPVGDITLDEPAQVDLDLLCWMKTNINGGDLRVRLAWNGSVTGDSYDLMNWGGVLYQSEPTQTINYTSLSLHVPLDEVPAGTMNVWLEAYVAGHSTGTWPSAFYTSLSVTARRWV